MDIATYISCRYYDRTGETYISFGDAISEYDALDPVTYLYIFLGMPALGYEKKTQPDGSRIRIPCHPKM